MERVKVCSVDLERRRSLGEERHVGFVTLFMDRSPTTRTALPLYDFSAFLLLFSLNPIWSKKSITKLDNIVLAKKMFIVYLAQNIKFSATQIHAII